MIGTTFDGHCRTVVDRLDAILREKSDCADETLADATSCVAALRDHLVMQRRERPHDAAVEARLRRVNSVLSLVVGSHYTLIGLRWQRITRARDEIAELLAHAGDGVDA